jgi:hypothetical protein
VRSAFKVGFLVVILATALANLVRSEFSMTAAAGGSPRPLWEVDLSKFGYQGRPPIHLEPEDVGGTWTYQQGAVFTERDVVAAFFVVHDEPSGVPSEERKPSPSDSYRLVSVFLNAENGELIKRLDWPLPPASNTAFFFPATRGRFVVGVGEKLSLYSPDFKLLAQHDLGAGMEAIASPSGASILLKETQKLSGQWTTRFDLLDTGDLSSRNSWTDRPQLSQALWGDELAWIGKGSIFLKTADAPAKTVFESKDELCGYWAFINKETIAATECGGAEKLLVVSTSGTVLNEIDLGLEQTDGPAVPSQNGRRFGVPTYQWGSGRNKDPEKLTALVFDVGSENPIFTADVQGHYGSSSNFQTPLGDTRFGWGGLALSPDGELLAVKSGPIVQMYQLPGPGRSSQCATDCSGADATAKSPLVRSQPVPISSAPTPSAPSELVAKALSWLPADTETVVAANGPFLLGDLNPDADTAQHGLKTDREIEDAFKSLPLALLGFRHGLLGKYLEHERVLLAFEGSRDFRPPSGLGEGSYQGCAFAIFAGDITDRANLFMKNSSTVALRKERIEGQQVSVFQEKLEQDIWTTFVAFPEPNMIVVATNEEYLRDVLARVGGKGGGRTLPENLPEWKHVDSHAAFWAVRHYDRKGAQPDPTSPFEGKKAANMPDDQAIGLTFTFDPAKSKTATIVYLSSNAEILQNVQKNLFPIETEHGARELHIRYRQLEPGVVEGSYDLDNIESTQLFVFVLEALLGHVLYI